MAISGDNASSPTGGGYGHPARPGRVSRNRSHRRGHRGLSLAAVLALVAVASIGSFSGPQDARANEYGAIFTQVGPSTWDVASPSGFTATFATTDVSEPGVDNQVINMAPRANISEGQQSPPIPAGTNGLGIGLSGGGNGVISYPIGWSGDQQWHPATSTTITFDHPVVSPTLSLGSAIATAVHRTDGVVDGAGTAGVQLRFSGASGPSGAVPISVSAKPGFNTGLYDVVDNTVTPKPVGGQIPYLSSHAIYCDPSTPQTTATSMSPYIENVFPDTRYIAGQCGSLQIDTGGQAITQLTLAQDLTFAAAAAGQPWNGASFTGTVISFSAPTQVSGSTTPATLGAATHVVSTLAIGTPGDAPTIDPAFANENLTSATAGTATDNSDAGFTADGNLVHTPITNHSTGTISVQVPYTGLSQDGFLNGWIDFNQNNRWDPGEEANSVVTVPHTAGANQSGTATLTLTVPTTAPEPTDSMWLRLRLAYDASDVANPTGMARSGEVEDHTLTVQDTTPDLAVAKTASVAGGGVAVVGSLIEYNVTVTNRSATVDAADVTITDTLPDGVDVDLAEPGTSTGLSYNPGTRQLISDPVNIAAGDSVTYTYFGTATATGTQRNVVVADTPLGCQTSDDVGDPCTSSSETDVQPTGALQLEKTTPGIADDAVFTLGQRVTYRFTVTNATPNPVTDIVLTDDMLGSGICTVPATSLAAGASTFCEVTYTVTQADIDAGLIINNATVAGNGPDGPVPGDDSTKTNDTGADPGPLVIAKTGTLPGGDVSAALGDTITYGITATNTSGHTMSEVTVTDNRAAGLTCTLGQGGPAVTFPFDGLAPGGVIVCSGTHVVTQADVDAGHVANVATGEGNLPPDPDNPDTPIPAEVRPGQDDIPVGGLTVLKQAFLGATEITNQVLRLGQVVTYRITTTNTSAYPITTLAVTDPFLSGQNVILSCDPSLPITLNHNESVVCSGNYTVKQADIDRGEVANTATATGEWPFDPEFPGMPVGPVPPASDSTDTPTDQDFGPLVLTKTATVNDGARTTARAGDTITYRITASNTSNLTMRNVSVRDSLLDAAGVPLTCTPALPVARLAPSAVINCQAKYTVTAADVANGSVRNTVTASGLFPPDPQNPNGAPVPVNPASTTTLTVGSPEGGPPPQGEGPGGGGSGLPVTGAAIAGPLGLALLLIGGGFLLRGLRRKKG